MRDTFPAGGGSAARCAARRARVPRKARAYLHDTVGRLWAGVMAGGEATVPERVQVRLASFRAATSAAQAGDLVYLTGGATASRAPSRARSATCTR